MPSPFLSQIECGIQSMQVAGHGAVMAETGTLDKYEDGFELRNVDVPPQGQLAGDGRRVICQPEAFDAFTAGHARKCANVTACLEKDRDGLLAFYSPPGTGSNAGDETIESTFATVRHTIRSKGCLSERLLVFKLVRTRSGTGAASTATTVAST